MGFFLTNIPLTIFHKKGQRQDLGEQLLKETQSFKRARSVPTTPLDWRYFFLFLFDFPLIPKGELLSSYFIILLFPFLCIFFNSRYISDHKICDFFFF